MFPHPDSTAFFFFGNDLFVLGLLDTFFICRCPLVFRLLNNFQPYIYIYMHLSLFIQFVNTSCLHFLFAVVCFRCTFCPFRDFENFCWGRPFVHLGTQRIFIEVSSSSIQGLREFCPNVNLVVPSQRTASFRLWDLFALAFGKKVEIALPFILNDFHPPGELHLNDV